MAYAAAHPLFAPAARRLPIWKRIVNAIAAARLEAAQRELRRHRLFLHETGLVQGEFRRIRLDTAGLLPFAE